MCKFYVFAHFFVSLSSLLSSEDAGRCLSCHITHTSSVSVPYTVDNASCMGWNMLGVVRFLVCVRGCLLHVCVVNISHAHHFCAITYGMKLWVATMRLRTGLISTPAPSKRSAQCTENFLLAAMLNILIALLLTHHWRLQSGRCSALIHDACPSYVTEDGFYPGVVNHREKEKARRTDCVCKRKIK